MKQKHHARSRRKATVCWVCGHSSDKIVRCAVCGKPLCTDCALLEGMRIVCADCGRVLFQQGTIRASAEMISGLELVRTWGGEMDAGCCASMPPADIVA
jgi:hypothetical protein